MADDTNLPTERAATSDEDFDRAAKDANLPEDTISLCLNAKLRREYERVKRNIDERAGRAAATAVLSGDVRMVSRDPASERDPEQDLLDALIEQMRSEMVTFLLRGMPSDEYNSLIDQHPPRRLPDGRIDERDYRGYNAVTFYSALVRRSIVKPTMTDARWTNLGKVLTDAQFDKLAKKATSLNRQEEDIPF